AAAAAPRIRRLAVAAAGDDDRPAPAQATGPQAPSVQAAVTPQQPALQLPAAVAAPVAASQAPADQPLATQLVPPIAALAAAGNGDHVVVVRVTPENLGTVTVRAHIADGSMKVELFAAPHARDAITAMLPDLRRDLAGSGSTSGATLGLGTGDAPQGGSRGSASDDRAPRWARQPAPAASLPSLPVRSPWPGTPAAGRLDVLA
ncbi:flagellar hook-length control protein FliK, partial [Amnibacterium sp.]|uniref:flagellar hook-length control protein FliK n=1 Tax=Amnibacterium sp. TaxID=1872496 RepID=UPI002601B41A